MSVSFLLVIAVTFAYFALAPRIFRSEAKLFVRMGRESVALDPTATTGPIVAAADSRENEVNAVSELLTSRALAEKVVDHFGPQVILETDDKQGPSLGQRLSWLDDYNLNPLRVYSVREKAIKAFLENVGTLTNKKTSVLSVSYESEDPQLAHDVLAALLELARDEHLRIHRTKGSQEFFVEQSDVLRRNLAQLEEQLRDLKDQTGLAALATQRQIKLELIGALQADLVRARAEQDAARAEVERRRQQLRDQPAMVVTEQTTGQPQTARQTLRERLYDLEIKEQELAVKLTAEAPLLVHLRNQIAEARRILADEQPTTQTTKGVNPTHQAAELALQEREALLVASTARTASLEAKLAIAEGELKQLNAAEVEITRLEREIDLTRANYRKYADNLEQARIDHELEQAKISSLNTMQPPSFAVTPVSPRPIATFALGFVGAVLCSLGAALFADNRRRSSPAISVSPSEIVPTRLRRSDVAPANPR
jgi:uncharacterized protein involved in exopolysaccharide biosynthesis